MVFALGLLAMSRKDTVSVVSSLLMLMTAVTTVRAQFGEYDYDAYDEWQGPHGHFHKTRESSTEICDVSR